MGSIAQGFDFDSGILNTLSILFRLFDQIKQKCLTVTDVAITRLQAYGKCKDLATFLESCFGAAAEVSEFLITRRSGAIQYSWHHN